MSSIKSYGRLDEAVELASLDARRKTRRRAAFITVSSVVLIAIVIAAVVGTTHRNSDSGNQGGGTPPQAASANAVCDITLYPDTCFATLPQAINTSNVTPEYLFGLSIKVALDELSKASKLFDNLKPTSNFSAAALENCRQLLDTAVDDLQTSVSTSSGGTSLSGVFDDLRTWLSSAATSYDTCIDGFDESSELRGTVVGYLKNSTETYTLTTSNALAIVTWISKLTGELKLRRLLMTTTTTIPIPTLNSTSNGSYITQSSASLAARADIVVAKDGSGSYVTIGDGLKFVKRNNKKVTVIYVKRGVYAENVRVEKDMLNVVMVGDGMDRTVVTGSLNVVDGTPTFSTATFAVFGKGFVGRDMAFQNTAGPAKHQAVALLASADQVVFHRCKVDAYQDSLYTHSNRQFFRDCDIYGTVDFIFGNAAAVLQNCRLLPRLPLKGQKNTITAQGRTDPNMNTGLSFQNCTISPAESLPGVRTYLGRPWKDFSVTIFSRSYLGSLIDPSGWLPWTGNSAPNTIFYAEFANFGPGSSTLGRVKWTGLKTNLKVKDVSKFSVTSFLQGDKWISDAGIPYNPST